MTIQDPLGAPVPVSMPPWAAEPSESWGDQTRNDPEATQSWLPSIEPEPEGMPGPPPAVPAWAAAPPPAPAEETDEAIVPDSWFAGSRGPVALEEPTERWAPQPHQAQAHQAQAGPDPWAPGAQAGWSSQPPPPHDQTTILDSGFAGPPRHMPESTGGSRHRQPGSRDNKPLIIGVAALVAVALIAVGIVMWPRGEGTASANSSPSKAPRKASQTQPKPGGPAQQQATAVHQLFVASLDTRNALGRALNSAKKCETLPAAIGGFQRVAQRRTNQINRTKALQVGAMKRGEQLRAALLKSFQLSLQVDQAFLAWAQGAQGCTGVTKHDANFANGVALSNQATVAKKQVTVLWNPVAKKEELPARTDRQF